MGYALVLGGGGVTGIAWETGLLKGLRDAGADVTGADVVIGTSAGSFVGAQVTAGIDLDRLFDQQVALASETDTPPRADVTPFLQLMAALAAEPGLTLEQLRARIGAMALQAEYPDGAGARLEALMARLPAREWPDRQLLITAVDASDGSPVTWERTSGVPLPLAVASSCSVPAITPPVEIRDRRYMDGGMRSATNADLAAGHDVVVVVAPTGAAPEGAPNPLAALPPDSAVAQWATALQREVADLRAGGADVHVIVPDARALEAIGFNVFDVSRREAVARAGLAQGAAAAASLVPALR